MKGDFSKWNLDDSSDNFNSVLHQQGRVLLDSDWNAQTQLLNDWQTNAGQDIIGGGVAAVPANNPDAFKVVQAKVASNPDRVELQIQPGRIWADGFSVNLAGTATLTRQATYLQPPIQNLSATVGSIGSGVRDAVILEVWQEAFNGFQKPETLIEPALGGPDTTERVQTAMAWRLYRLADDENCDNIRGKLGDKWDQKGKLTVSLQDTTATNGDCPVVSAGGYTGFEHYLYRVEIAHTTDGTSQFKWSQFNGGLVGRGVFQAASGGQPGKVIITHNLQAIIHAGIGKFYLEVIEYDPASGNQQVIYGATASLNDSNELELATTAIFGIQPVSPSPALGELPKTYFFRLWNGIEDIAAFAVNPAKELPYGILLKFEDPTSSGKTYTPGDYWTFKVRAGEIPNASPLINNQPPEGIVYHRVPVAELNWNTAKDVSFAKQEIEDCRQPFRPLTNQKGCCTFSVGDGKRSQGDFNSIKDAIFHLPPSGGKICVLPGIHEANVDIINRRDIQITGCGVHSIVHPQATETATSEPIFRIAFSRNIQIDHLTLVTVAGTGIQVLDNLNLLPRNTDIRQTSLQDSTGIHILWNNITSGIHAIKIRTRNETQGGNNDIWIAHNQIYLLDKPTGKTVILSIADGVLIERNRVLVVPPPQDNDPQDPRQPDDPSVGVFDPCKPLKFYYGSQFPIYKFVQSLFLYAAKFLVVKKPPYLAEGGIQIGSSSDGVKIVGNEIVGGWGNGITLGHLPEGILDDNASPNDRIFIADLPSDRLERLRTEFVSHLYTIAIEENKIQKMGLSGIGVVSFFKLETIQLMLQVENLTIYRNQISQCAQQLPTRIPDALVGQVGFGGIALTGCEYATIQENRIENNGVSYLDPVCGIFILFGDRIEISNNYILNNGKLVKKTEKELPRRGLRGGIFISLSWASRAAEFLGDIANVVAGLPFDDGVPAIKVHGNVVTQPLGQALFVIAIGPVSVVGNQFTSQDIDAQADFFTSIAGAVFILNLGFTIQEILGLALLKATQFGQAKYNATSATIATDNGFALQTGALEAAFFYGTFWPSGKVLFNDNQTTLDLRATEIDSLFSSQFIFTLDDIGFSSNQSDCNTLIDVLVTNTFLMGFSIRTNDNRFREGLIFTVLSLFSFGILNTNTYNQGSHCFLALASSSQLRVDRDNIVLFDQICKSFVDALTERYK